MASLNKVILIGHLTADPELKQTATGIPVTSFSIGVTRRFTRQGEQPPVRFYQHRRLAEHSGVLSASFSARGMPFVSAVPSRPAAIPISRATSGM